MVALGLFHKFTGMGSRWDEILLGWVPLVPLLQLHLRERLRFPLGLCRPSLHRPILLWARRASLLMRMTRTSQREQGCRLQILLLDRYSMIQMTEFATCLPELRKSIRGPLGRTTAGGS